MFAKGPHTEANLRHASQSKVLEERRLPFSPWLLVRLGLTMGFFCVLVTQAPPMSVVVDEVLSKVPSVDAAGDLGGHYDG